MFGDKKIIKVGLVGLGVVGKGTLEVLCRNQAEIMRRAGIAILVSDIASRDINKTTQTINAIDSTYPKPHIHIDGMAVANADIDVLVELVGGTTIAKDVILQAIKNKKHIVTANKALIARHGKEIFDAAKEHGVVVAFEAAVAGGVPIIKAIREGLSANKIDWLAGIINGTTNFILSEMDSKGISFAHALAQAQSLGYAEADPTFDIEGIDAAHKISILASLAFGIPISFDNVYIEGISDIKNIDMNYAKDLGYKIKLLGIAKNTKNGIELRVHPALIPQQHMLANVNGAMNAVMVNGDAVGQTLYYGKGAGSEATASAIIADLIDVVREINTNTLSRVPHLAFQEHSLVNTPVLDISAVHTRYYLRLNVSNKAGVMSVISSELASNNISISALLQKESNNVDANADVIILTNISSEHSIDKSIENIRKKVQINEAIKIRLEFLD
jgi:homoserine dehydrogenase